MKSYIPFFAAGLVLTGILPADAQSKVPPPAPPFTSVKGLEQFIDAKQKAEPDAETDYLEAYRAYLKQRAYPNDTVDWSVYPRAVQRRDSLPPARSAPTQDGTQIASGAKWQFIGPNNLDVPYQIYYGQGPLAGRINAAAYDPSHSGTYYIGTAGGGVWKTTDSGSTWKPLSDKWPFLQVSSVTLDPTNSNIIYAGTGDFDGYGPYGFGMMKSTDAGATWTNYGQSQFSGLSIRAILVDPENPKIVTLTTGRGPVYYGFVWRSTDGGQTFKSVINTYAPWCDLRVGAKDSTGKRYYYAVGQFADGANNDVFHILRSTDRGATWTQLNPPLTSSAFYSQDGLSAATSPTDPKTVYLVSGYDQKVLKSTDAGDTWTDVSGNLPSGYNWSQEYYDIFLNCVSQTVDGVKTDFPALSLIDLLQSPTAGSNWNSLGGPTYSDSSILHNDQHSTAFNPKNPQQALVGNDGGLFRLTEGAGAQSPSYVSLNKALGITQFYKADYHPTNPNILVGGAQDNAAPTSSGSLSHWINPGGGDGAGCAINPKSPGIQYVSSQYLGIYHTTDTWQTEDYISPDFGSDTISFIAPMTLDPTHPNLLYVGTNYVWRWDETTKAWTGRLGNQQVSSTDSVTAIVVAPSDSKRIYTGSGDGELWMSTDTGATWTQINTGTTSLPNRTITSITVSPTNASDIRVGLSGTGASHLWECTKTTAGSSRTWIDRSGSGSTGLPDIPLNAIAPDPDSPASVVYVATDVGVFQTTNNGSTWANETAPLGLPNVQVNDLKAVPGTRFLNAATYGRGLWRISLGYAKPTVSLFSPTSGKVGTTVTITGTNLTGTTKVTFNGTAATTFTVVSATQVTAKVPTGATTGTIAVTTPGGTATNPNLFTVTTSTSGPTVQSLSLSPTSVKGGSSSTGTITLTAPAPTGGLAVTQTSSNTSAATLAGTLNIAAGVTTAKFKITTYAVTSTKTVTITSTANGTSKSATLTVTP